VSTGKRWHRSGCPDFDFDSSQFVDADDLLTLYDGFRTNDPMFDISGNGVVDN
jgi:hypothetical protein